MATYTTNYNLKKYNPADRVDATAQNGNLDAIDAAIKAVFDAPAFDEEDDFHDTVGLYAYTQVPTATYTKKYAHYWRKGDLIYFTIALSGNISVAGVNGACISGLPFNVDANHIRDFSMSISILTGGIAASSTGLSCVPWGSNVLIVRARVGDYPVWTTGNYDFVISGWYKKA